MADNSVPDGAEMTQLQQEAIRRAREMQARAQIPVTRLPVQPEPPPPPEPEMKPEPEQTPHPRVEQMPVHPKQENRQTQNRRPDQSSPAGQPLGGTLDFLTKDPERAMILLLMLILMEEKADNSLLFAMMYLLS